MSDTRLRLVAVMAAVAILLATACRRPRTPARIIQVVPAAAEVGPDGLRSGIRLIFDRAVAPPSAVGAPLAQPVLDIEPPLAGETR
jgi:hypothetical protein